MTSDGFDTYGNGPQYGEPGPSGQPQYDQPQYGQPQYDQPQHGQPQGGAPYGRVGRSTNSLAIASLCLGIGQVVAWILAGIPAIVLGFMALNQIRQTGEDGRGLAITGIVLGFIGIIATALLIIFFVAIIHGLSNNTATS
jgi:hypothetical protein